MSARLIFTSFLNLTFIKVLGILINLIIIPYIALKIGLEQYGIIAFQLVITQILLVIIKFGTESYFIKEFAIISDDLCKVNVLINKILTLRIGIFIIILFPLIYYLIYLNYDISQIGILIFYLFFEIFIIESFYIGTNRTKLLSKFAVINKSTLAIFLIIFYSIEIDLILAFLISSFIYFFLNQIWLSVNLKNKIKITFLKINFIKELFYLSVSDIGAMSIGKIHHFVIKIFLGYEFLGIYDLALKYINIITSPFNVLSRVLMPINTNKLTLRRILISCFIIGVFAVIGIYFFPFYKELGILDIEISIKKLSLIIPFNVLSTIIVLNIMIVNNLNKQVLESILLTFLVICLIYLTLYFLNKISFSAVLFCVVAGYSFDCIYRIIKSKNYL